MTFLNCQKNSFFLSFSFAFVLSLFATPSFAQTDTTNALGQTQAITTAVPFLMICPDSRSGGMGEAGVAVADNANALFWNPSALAFSKHKLGVQVNYTPWLRGLGIPDINHAFLPFYYNFGTKGGMVGMSLTYFSLGNITFTDNGGIVTGQASANEFALAGYYSRQITETFAMGTALRFIYSDLGLLSSGGKAGMSFSGDINLYYKKEFALKSNKTLELRVGANISNIGAKMNYSNSTQRDFIPTNMKFGYALKLHLDQYNTITFANDFNKLMVPSEGGRSDKNMLSGMFGSFGDAKGGFKEEMQEFNVQLGLEYWYNNLFSVRAGYFYEAPNKGARQFVTVGAGVKFKMFTLDFAYLAPFTQNHPLQNTLRFSLGVNIGEVVY